jgi:hypothetical protein
MGERLGNFDGHCKSSKLEKRGLFAFEKRWLNPVLLEKRAA